MSEIEEGKGNSMHSGVSEQTSARPVSNATLTAFVKSEPEAS